MRFGCGVGRRDDGLEFTRALRRAQSEGVESREKREPAVAGAPAEDARLDKWLWCVRAYKTRALAAEACRLGRVTVDGRAAKPASTVRPGWVIEAREGVVTRRLTVLAVPRGRQGAARAKEFVRDETPPEALEVAREQRVQHILAGGGARPTKRDRRARERLWREPDVL